MAFHQRVRDGYLQLAASEPERFLTVSANGTVDDISTIIAELVFARLALQIG
jgi:dTMP kinase